jgi:hypothetical protein
MEDFYHSSQKEISNHFSEKSYNTFNVDNAGTENIPYNRKYTIPYADVEVESRNATRNYQGIILSSISMLLAVISASSIGPMFKVVNSLQKSETSYQYQTWTTNVQISYSKKTTIWHHNDTYHSLFSLYCTP